MRPFMLLVVGALVIYLAATGRIQRVYEVLKNPAKG